MNKSGFILWFYVVLCGFIFGFMWFYVTIYMVLYDIHGFVGILLVTMALEETKKLAY